MIHLVIGIVKVLTNNSELKKKGYKQHNRGEKKATKNTGQIIFFLQQYDFFFLKVSGQNAH